MGKSKISWTDYTFNPWIGCTKVSAGCVNCYAERDNKHRQWNKAGWGKGVPRHRTSETNWKKPYHWNKLAKEKGVRYKVFCASLADLFDNEVPINWRTDALAVIDETENLDWLLLTKRPETVMENVLFSWTKSWPEHVWMGVTTENQEQANIRCNHLLNIQARIRFLSCEPLLSCIDFRRASLNVIYKDKSRPTYSGFIRQINWVIVGGESGKENRHMNPVWARDILEQCQESNTAFFMKQMSGNTKALREAIPEDLQIYEFPT